MREGAVVGKGLRAMARPGTDKVRSAASAIWTRFGTWTKVSAVEPGMSVINIMYGMGQK